ncbi:thiamine-phosphate kinase [Haematomicrobium sanguinis]|uniref:thiamine-phosphate kinase n=1 Tax=Haematomicrobium sanguinis TaxID=479106 RepID=UPI00069013B9|nr:thiamine-phosphate kinase [Haematomicrobium sanguinis]
MRYVSVSEGELINRILLGSARLERTKATLGPGDDAAILPPSFTHTAVTVDTVTEGQDFRWNWPSGVATTLADIGWKLAAQNLSDINAMGASPTFMLLSCTLDPYARSQDVADLATGIAECCHVLGANQTELVGGDTGSGTEFSASLTVLGSLKSGRNGEPQTLLRSSGRPGDRLYVAGALGQAAAGLAILESVDPSLVREFPELFLAQTRPQPTLTSGQQAVSLGVRCGMDISDGLVVDASRIALASTVQVDLNQKHVDRFVSADLNSLAERMKVDPLHWVLGGGEDYALLVAAPPEIRLPEEFAVIGELLERSDTNQPLVTLDGNKVTGSMGWDPFAEQK